MERHKQRKVLTTGQESTQRMAMNEGRMDGRDVQRHRRVKELKEWSTIEQQECQENRPRTSFTNRAKAFVETKQKKIKKTWQEYVEDNYKDEQKGKYTEPQRGKIAGTMELQRKCQKLSGL